MNIPVITQKPAEITEWATVDFTHGVVVADETVSPPWRIVALCRSLSRAESMRKDDPFLFEDELFILDLGTGEFA